MAFFADVFSPQFFHRSAGGERDVYRNVCERHDATKRGKDRNIPIISRTNSGSADDYSSRDRLAGKLQFQFALRNAEVCAFFMSVT